VRLERAAELLRGRVRLEPLWRPFEIHPEVPVAGRPLSSLPYTPDELAAMMENLRRHAAAEGLAFAARSPHSLLANTHRALAAGAYAQREEPERFAEFHHALFRAAFTEDRNVGDPGVLRAVAAASGLDLARLDAALDAGTYEPALREAAAEARRRGITAVPSFDFGGGRLLVGAHPPEALAQAAERAAAAED
jgi:predicted DsbA family dithiol-disulfide isomerase